MPQASRQRHKHKPQDEDKMGTYLREIVFILFCFVSLYLFISLFTYNPLDLGHWVQQEQASPEVLTIQNKGGQLGAKFADWFFSWFGYFAYLFAFMVAYVGWLFYQDQHHDLINNPQTLVIPGIGFILTLSAGCGLAIVHFAAESALLPSHAGGILGTWVGSGLKSVLNAFGATLLLLVLFFTGITLLTSLSWLRLMDSLGAKTLYWMPILWEKLSRVWIPLVLVYLRRIGEGLVFIGTQISQKIHVGIHSLRDYWQQYQQRRYNEDYSQPSSPNSDNKAHKEDDLSYVRRRQTVRQTTQQAAHKQTAQTAKQRILSTPSPVIPATEEVIKSTQNNDDLTDQPVLYQASDPVEQKIQQQVQDVLQALNIQAHICYIQTGPALIHIELQTEAYDNGRLLNARAELAKRMNMPKLRLYEIASEQLVLEMPNPSPEEISLNDLLQNKSYTHSHSPLMLALGKDISGHPVIVDLSRMPHLLMGGQLRHDMDLLLNNVLISLLHKNSPEQVRLLLLDSQSEGFCYYDALPHLLTPVIERHSADKYHVFNWCVREMERRYRLMADMGVRNIEAYNQRVASHNQTDQDQIVPVNLAPIAYIVLMVHELSELLSCEQGEKIQALITRLAQKARAAGIHMVLATAQPLPEVISQLMKTNFPTRIACQVANQTDSMNLLGRAGAEYLLGDGDMFYLTPGTATPARLHAAQMEEEEAELILDKVRSSGQLNYQNIKGLD